jgi:hypothetical protein
MQQEGSEFSVNRMSINYESVQYGRGQTDTDSAPQGFGTPQHYDTFPSPLPTQSGPESSILGAANSVRELKKLGSNGTSAELQRRFYLGTDEQQLPGTPTTTTSARQFGAYSFANMPVAGSETIAAAKRF